MLKRIKSRISYQLLFNIIAVIVALLLVITVAVGSFIVSITQRELGNRLSSEMHLAVREIEILFENAATRVRQLGLDASVEQYLKEVNTKEAILEHPLYNRVYASLKSIAGSDKDVFLAWVANEAANFYLDSAGVIPGDDYDVAKRPWYSVAVSQNGVAYTEPYIEWGTGELVVSAIEAQRDKGDIYGFTVIDFRLDNLPISIQAINVGEKGYRYVVDQKGNYLYHPNDEMMLSHTIHEEMPSIAPLMNKDPSASGQSAHRGTLVIDQSVYDVYAEEISPMGWQIITLVNRTESRQELTRFLMLLGVGVLLFVVVLGFVMQHLIENKLEPMAALKAYSIKIANGEFSEEPPYHYAKRQDEMGEIARSFVTITEVFKQKNALLEEIVTSQYHEIQQQYHYILEKEKIASLGTLVAGVAHEINTPLGVGVTTASYIDKLVGELQILFRERRLSAQQLEQELMSLQDASDILNNNLKRAADLVIQFKAVATNQNISELAPMNLYQEIDNVIASLKPTYKYRDVQILNQVHEQIILTSFAGAFNQILTNLIVNSMHHAFEENQSGMITIDAWVEGELVRIIYSDNGKGISDEVLDHIFEPFFTTRRSGGNSGLGMYITHNLITQTLSGTIHIENRPEGGVKFVITVPMHLEV